MTNATTKSLTQHPCSIVLGTQARPALWNPGREGDLQIRALTGQTAFAQLKKVADAGWSVYIIDTRKADFDGLRNYPGIAWRSTSLQEHLELINDLHMIMTNRSELIRNGEQTKAQFQPTPLIVSEASLLAQQPSRESDESSQASQAHTAQNQIEDLASRGRDANISTAVSIPISPHRPFTDDVNYPVRLHTVSPTATFLDKR